MEAAVGKPRRECHRTGIEGNLQELRLHLSHPHRLHDSGDSREVHYFGLRHLCNCEKDENSSDRKGARNSW